MCWPRDGQRLYHVRRQLPFELTEAEMRWYSAVGWLCFCWGCAPVTTQVDVATPTSNAEVTIVPSLLASELINRSGGPNDHAMPVTIENTAATPRMLIFESTGCSCYGVLLNDVPLNKSDQQLFSAGEQRTYVIQAHPEGAERESDFRANFRWEGDGGSTPCSVIARLQVYEDARVRNQISLQVPPEQLGEPILHAVELIRTSRSRALLDEAPRLISPAEFISVASVDQKGVAEELAPGIWRQHWLMQLQIVPPEYLSAEQPGMILKFEFPSDDATQPFVAKSQVLLQLAVPIQYPSRLAFGRIPVGSPRTRKFMIRSAQGTSFGIQVSPESSSSLTVNCPGDHAQEHWVDVTYSPDTVGPIQERLIFTTDHQRMPRLEVQLTGTAFLE